MTDQTNPTQRMTRNLHIHPWYCRHADGEVAEFCQRALEIDIPMIGFSDHVPLPDGRWEFDRMYMDLLDDYNAAVDSAKESFPQLTIFKGMECECVQEFESYYREELLHKRRFDYLIGSIHYVNVKGDWLFLFTDPLDLHGLRAYAKAFIEAIECELYTFIAHPDLLGFLYPDWDDNVEACVRDVMAVAKEYGIVLEVNSKGFRRPMIDTQNGPRYSYPWRPFWEIVAEFDIPIIINTDAHRTSELNAGFEEACKFVNSIQLREVSDDDILTRMMTNPHHLKQQEIFTK